MANMKPTSNGDVTAAFTALTVVSATFPALIRNLLAITCSKSRFFNNTSFGLTLLTEFLLIVMPVELMVTLLNHQSTYFLAITSVIIVAIILHHVRKPEVKSSMNKSSFLSLAMEKAPFISYFRAYTNIFTGFSIFAVDFMIYPSYFVKSRVYGHSLMDTGLGYYLISNAIVSNEAKGIICLKSVRSSLLKAIKDTIPLLVLGVLRFCMTSVTGYHVSMQEYGIHWNFFFTLAVVKFLSTACFCITPQFLWPFLGFIIILPYQYCLSTTSLFPFVFFGFSGRASRDGFVEANREGIVSSIGFLAVYFVGQQLGRILMLKRERVKDWMLGLCQMVCVCTTSWLLMFYSDHYIQRTSRKLANLSYLFFVTGVSSLLMIEGLVFDIILIYVEHIQTQSQNNDIMKREVPDYTSPLLMAVNYNGLLFFVLANIMTGAVNIVLDTRNMSSASAFTIVTIYMFILSLIFLFFYRRKFSFKALLWRKRHRQNLKPLNI